MWEDPWKKPCYLFALVAGDLAVEKSTFKTMTGRTVRPPHPSHTPTHRPQLKSSRHMVAHAPRQYLVNKSGCVKRIGMLMWCVLV